MRDAWKDAQVVASVDLGGLKLVFKTAAGQDQPLGAIAKVAPNGAVVSAIGFKLTTDVRQALKALADVQPPKPAAKPTKAAAAAADSGAVKALEDRIGRIEALLQRLVK